jgi:uncharacterized protein DUF4145
MGKITTSIKNNETLGDKYKIYCGNCNNDTNHLVLQSVDTSGSEVIFYVNNNPNMPETIDWADHYQIIQCQGCENITFRHLNWFSEYQEYYGPNDYNDGTTVRIYPKKDKNTLSLNDYYNVPNSIRRLYRETIDCFNNEALTLCAAGLRSIVEGICLDQGIKNGPVEITKPDGSTIIKRKSDLRGKIKGLYEKGILTSKNSEILNEHRFLGNEAVHELSQPSVEELSLAIEIVEHTLDDLYEIPEKAEELVKKRVKRKKT